MTLATTPTSAITATPRFAAMCDRRWREWRGPVAVWLAATASSQLLYATAVQRTHRARLLALLAVGIEMRVVRRLSLDDPRESAMELDRRRDLYLAGRRKRRDDDKN